MFFSIFLAASHGKTHRQQDSSSLWWLSIAQMHIRSQSPLFLHEDSLPSSFTKEIVLTGFFLVASCKRQAGGKVAVLCVPKHMAEISPHFYWVAVLLAVSCRGGRREQAAFFSDGSLVQNAWQESIPMFIGFGNLTGIEPQRDCFGWFLFGCLMQQSRKGVRQQSFMMARL